MGAGAAAWWLWTESRVDRQRVWRIGADHAPPYYFLQPDGPIQGLAVDVLNAAAERSGVKLEWVRVEAPETLDDAFHAGRVDLWPAVAETPERIRHFRFTEPWLENSYGLLTRTDLVPPVDRVEDVAGRVIAIRASAIFRHLAGRSLPSSTWSQYPQREQTVTALCRGEAAAAVVEVRFLDTIMMERPEGCASAKFRLIMIPGAMTKLRIMSTPEAERTAAHLRRSITSLALENRLSATLERWSALASQDTRSAYELEQAVHSRKVARYALAALALGLLLFAWLYRQSARQRKAAQKAMRLAEKANAAKSEFLANMSHEIRTPLNAIVGMTQLALEGERDRAKREELESVRISAEALMQLINDVLDLSKIEAGHLRVETAPFHLARLIEEVMAMFRPHAAARGLALLCDYDAGAGEHFTGDAVRIRQVLTNLVGNAVKFTDQGEVRIEVRRVRKNLRKFVRIAVRDTGIGIPWEAQARLFQKFQQADTSTSRTHGGTGLGLAISRQLVELMGGKIRLDSVPGAGSTFTVELPLDPLKNTAPVPDVDADPPDLTRVSHGKGRILLAEDNALNQKVILRALERINCDVDIARNGEEALDLWTRQNYDLVLMDCQMPVVDGYEASARIRKAERQTGRRTPIVAVTANALESERLRCLAAGMDDYIPKPFDLERLRETVMRYTGRATSPSPSSSHSSR
jgi:signal transduction histidine kinase/CheY-like chemotaxis protein